MEQDIQEKPFETIPFLIYIGLQDKEGVTEENVLDDYGMGDIQKVSEALYSALYGSLPKAEEEKKAERIKRIKKIIEKQIAEIIKPHPHLNELPLRVKISEVEELITPDTTVLGIGGGKVIDVAKLSSFNQGVYFVSMPTTASHDGIVSPMASVKNPNTIFLFIVAVSDGVKSCAINITSSSRPAKSTTFIPNICLNTLFVTSFISAALSLMYSLSIDSNIATNISFISFNGKSNSLKNSICCNFSKSSIEYILYPASVVLLGFKSPISS